MALSALKPQVELWLELETRCNLNCLFCYNFWKDGSAKKPRSHATAVTVAALRGLLNVVDCRQIAISGGEPLLRRDLPEILEGLRDYEIPKILTTNGTLLTHERIMELMQHGVVDFQVSLHSHREEIHNQLSGGQRCWREAIAAIVAVRECGAEVTPVFVATELNLNDFPSVIEIGAALGLAKIIFNRFVPTGLGSIYERAIGVPDDAAIWRMLTDADLLAAKSGISIYLGVPIRTQTKMAHPWRSIKMASCPVRSGQRRWTIGSDLSIRRCNHSGLAIGNLLGNGTEKLLSELRFENRGGSCSDLHPCQFLEPDHPVQIRVGSS